MKGCLFLLLLMVATFSLMSLASACYGAYCDVYYGGPSVSISYRTYPYYAYYQPAYYYPTYYYPSSYYYSYYPTYYYTYSYPRYYCYAGCYWTGSYCYC